MASFPQLLLLVHGVFLEKAAGSCPLIRVKMSDGYSDKKRLETNSTPKYYFGFKSMETPPVNNFTLLCEQASTSEPLRIGVGLKWANGSKTFIPKATESVEMLFNDDSTIEDVDDKTCNGLYSTHLQRVGKLLGFNSVIPEVSKSEEVCSTRWIEPTCNVGFCKCDTKPCKCDNGDSCGSVDANASVNRLQVVLFTHATTTTTAFKTTTTAAASTTTTIQAVVKKEAKATTTTTTNQSEPSQDRAPETPLLLVVAGIVVLRLSFFD
jgi:hypothetical protein